MVLPDQQQVIIDGIEVVMAAIEMELNIAYMMALENGNTYFTSHLDQYIVGGVNSGFTPYPDQGKSEYFGSPTSSQQYFEGEGDMEYGGSYRSKKRQTKKSRQLRRSKKGGASKQVKRQRQRNRQTKKQRHSRRYKNAKRT